jgi:hypothetical protein
MKPDLVTLSQMDQDEQQDAIEEIARGWIAEGVTQDEVDELERLCGQISVLAAQRLRPN